MSQYRFQPVEARLVPDDARLFTGRLRRALRAAHGLGISIRLSWRSGLESPVTLAVTGAVGRRWMQFALCGAYDMGQWQALDAIGPSAVGRPLFVLGSRRAAELPFPSAPDTAPWSEAVLGELIGSRPGVEIAWDLRPDSRIPAGTGSPIPYGVGPREEPRVRPQPARALEDHAESRRTGLHWWVRGEVRARPGAETRESAVRLCHLLEIASQLDGGNGIRALSGESPFKGLFDGLVLSEAELVGLFPPPISSVQFPSRAMATGGPGLWIGQDLRGLSVTLPLEPTQGRHLLVLGETGMGKSSLVVRLAWQALHWGNVLFFDPIGDTAQEFLAGLPETWKPRVSWFSPAAPGLTLNLFAEVDAGSGSNRARRDRLVGDLVGALRRVRAGRYVDSSFWGPRLEEMLFQALQAASLWPGASLVIAERLLAPPGLSLKNVPESARPAVEDLQRRLHAAPQDGEGARRLLSEVTRRDVLRRLLDSESPTWSIESALAPRHITVLSGDAPQIGESAARHLLAIVLALVWNATLARRAVTKTFLILDEAQWYSHETVAEMLRLGRRFNLHVWAATQSLGSLPDSVREAFTTNSADVVLFRGAPDEARDFARWVPGISAERIMRLHQGAAAVLLGKGAATHWVQLPVPRSPVGDPARFASYPAPELTEEPVRTTAPPWASSPDEQLVRSPGIVLTEGPLADALIERARRPEVGEEVTVRLPELRQHFRDNPAQAEPAVRAGGRLLASKGVLLRSGKDAAGSFWVLSRARLAAVLPGRSDPMSLAPPDSPQARVGRRVGNGASETVSGQTVG
jgi:hypothetical protein